MNTLQTRLELQAAVQQWIDSFMAQHNISPAMMDDALSKALLNIKELVVQEYLIAAQMASSNQQEDVKEEPDEQEYITDSIQ